MADLLGFGPWIFNKLFPFEKWVNVRNWADVTDLPGFRSSCPITRRLGIHVCRINFPSLFASLIRLKAGAYVPSWDCQELGRSTIKRHQPSLTFKARPFPLPTTWWSARKFVDLTIDPHEVERGPTSLLRTTKKFFDLTVDPHEVECGLTSVLRTTKKFVDLTVDPHEVEYGLTSVLRTTKKFADLTIDPHEVERGPTFVLRTTRKFSDLIVVPHEVECGLTSVLRIARKFSDLTIDPHEVEYGPTFVLHTVRKIADLTMIHRSGLRSDGRPMSVLDQCVTVPSDSLIAL